MKVGHVTLGQGVTVGAGATVLYDTHIGDYVQLGGLTVVMKGESMPAHTRWHGAPAVPETSKLHESTSSTERKATA
jgi:serine acetyltransferase